MKVSTESHKDKVITTESNQNRQIIREASFIKSKHYYWNGKDYSNPYNKDFQSIAEFSKGSFRYIST